MMEEIFGAPVGAMTVKLKGFDCLPSGLLTRKLHTPATISLIRSKNEEEVTVDMGVISALLRVVPPPLGEVMLTVRFCWKLLPYTATS